MCTAHPPRNWRCRDRILSLDGRTAVMGILNVTPDSFYDGGRYQHTEAALTRAHAMIADGADILDIGGASSRPGAEPVPERIELERVLPVIEPLARETEVLISVDTTRCAVARAALEAGAHIVNDITAGQAEPDILPLAAGYRAGFVLMHMQGEPRTMQHQPVYADVVAEVGAFLAARRRAALAAGLPEDALVLDPGIGFGKTYDHNWTLLAGLPVLAGLGSPLLVGVSRKRFLGELCGRDVDDRLAASLAAATQAMLRGAAIIRVHDVKETCDLAAVMDRLRQEEQRTFHGATD
jgi:dihydropteroate synthase